MATVLCTGLQPTLTATRKLILELAGHRVVAVESDHEVVSACREFRFDVVVISQGEVNWKRARSALVRSRCPSVKVLEIYLPSAGMAVEDADDWLLAPAIPDELAMRVAVLAGQEKSGQLLTIADPAGSHQAPMEELEQQIRQVCLHLLQTEEAQFGVTCVELEAALDQWDRLKEKDGEKSAAP